MITIYCWIFPLFSYVKRVEIFEAPKSMHSEVSIKKCQIMFYEDENLIRFYMIDVNLMDEMKDILFLFYPFVEIDWMIAEARVSIRPVIIIKITFFDRWEIPKFSEISKSPMINDSKLSSQVNFVSC